MEVIGYINKYLKEYKNYKDYWNYEDGCILAGCRELYYALKDRRYLDFVLDYLEPLIAKDGTIKNFPLKRYSLDSFCAGRSLFFAYDESGDDIYKRAIFFLMNRLNGQPRTNEGSFWHKAIYPFQVWLDGLYMVHPFYIEYERRFNNLKNHSDVLNQFLIVRKYMYDSQKKLYHHGYDESKVMPWADDRLGTSRGFWLRSMGWYMMALADITHMVDDNTYADLFVETADGILNYAHPETMLFYQVIDKPNMLGNYTETSGSAMIAYSLMKFSALNSPRSREFANTGLRIINSLEQIKLINIDEKLSLTDICLSAGLGPDNSRDGSAEYYISEKKVSDDPKGVGAFMMTYAQKLMYYIKQNKKEDL